MCVHDRELAPTGNSQSDPKHPMFGGSDAANVARSMLARQSDAFVNMKDAIAAAKRRRQAENKCQNDT